MAAKERMWYTAVAAVFQIKVLNERELSKLTPRFLEQGEGLTFTSLSNNLKLVTLARRFGVANEEKLSLLVIELQKVRGHLIANIRKTMI